MDAIKNNLNEIYTIGHSSHSGEKFLHLLSLYHIEGVVDVRSQPYSQYANHFNKESVDKLLSQANIKYIFLGDRLGGRPDKDEHYNNKGQVDYQEIAGLQNFQDGISSLLKALQNYRLALMCGEEDPSRCHRRLLVGKVLTGQGVRIRHIRGDGRLQSEEELTAEENYQKNKGQMSLFPQEEAEEWKSTRSVSPKKVRRNSSKP